MGVDSWLPTTTTTIPIWQPRWLAVTTTGATTVLATTWYWYYTETDGHTLYERSTQIYSPAIMRSRQRTAEEIARRDQELYQRAVLEHDHQEAERIARMIAERERQSLERQEREAQRQIALREQQAQREVAKTRANELLLQHLTPAQRETFSKHGWFIVEGGKTKTKYRIRAVDHMVANVDVYERQFSLFNNPDQKITHRLCAHVPTNKVPLGDQLLAQKMMLEFSEDDFLRIANRH
jgi:hypothetical protein